MGNWATAYDSLLVETPAVAAGRYISYVVSEPVVPSMYINYTTYPTGTNPVTTTYAYSTNTASFTQTYGYATVAAVAASVTRVDSLQTFSITGDGTNNLQFDAGGAGCYKLLGAIPRDISTVTTTITVSPFDIYQ